MRTHSIVVGLFFIIANPFTAACNIGEGDCPSNSVGQQIVLVDPSPSADCATRCSNAGDVVVGCRAFALPAGADVNAYECTRPSMKIGESCPTPRLVCQTSSTRVTCGDDHVVHPVSTPEPAYVQCDLHLSCE